MACPEQDAGGSRRIVVCFTPFIPYEGITHAGGEFLLRHLKILSDTYDIVVVAPLDSQNRLAVARIPGWILALEVVPVRESRLATMLAIAHKALHGTAYDPFFERAVRGSARIENWLRLASAVDFEWTQSAIFSAHVRKLNPHAKQILVVHDILSQRWRRSLENARGASRRLFYTARLGTALFAEKWRFAKVDHVVTFSWKDADAALRVSPNAHVVAAPPPLSNAETPRSLRELRKERQSAVDGEVLFVGAMARPENEDAALWLVAHVWPRVLSFEPSAHLTLAGANPSRAVRALSSASVTVTGEVPSLVPYYQRASLFVAPLRLGAGVKFKIIDAMLRGVPVVSTSVGAEGIGNATHYVGISDDAMGLADAMVHGLRDSQLAQSIAERAFAWASDAYGEWRLGALVGSLYG